MTKKRNPTSIEKTELHPRNLHRERYDFQALIASCPALKPFVKINEFNNEFVDFFNAAAVRMLNKSILIHHYGLEFWEIPPHFLCPPIPGRADYVHYVADLLAVKNGGKIPIGASVRCLDLGVGANCVYPIIGQSAYGWSFVGSEIDPIAVENAQKIVELNPNLTNKIEIRLQTEATDIFQGIIKPAEKFDLTICNPPFHTSSENARSGNIRKNNNLRGKKSKQPNLNFGGQKNELWCEGGEKGFVETMIAQSEQFATQCFWFSTLISKQSNLDNAQKLLAQTAATDVKMKPMGQGNKTSRILAWTFFDKTAQKNWVETNWKNC
jgi:23S rRNA (adenine1618-N6)-methyltransferase